jgi:hypothetical protein
MRKPVQYFLATYNHQEHAAVDQQDRLAGISPLR